jgi:hypothetical protein
MDVAIVGGALTIFALLVSNWLGRRQGRQDRLRTLYADVLHAAIRATPRNLGYRLGPDEMLTSDDEMNLLRARLSVEAPEDEDIVMQALVGVYNFSSMYRGEYESHNADPDRVLMKDLRATEQRVRDAMDLMNATIRKRLAATDRLLPELRWPRRKVSKPASKK